MTTASLNGTAPPTVAEEPPQDTDTLLRARGLFKHFPIRSGVFNRISGWVKAVDGVELDVKRGETLSIVGESGCGKSTMARCVLRLIEPTDGVLTFDGEDMTHKNTRELKRFRREMQIVFQDPYTSLNPRMTIDDTVAFNLIVHGVSRKEARAKAREALDQVGLASRNYARRYPHELSGGQRQRVNIARALVMKPKLVVLDEPVSALDKSVQAQVLNLLSDLKREMGLTYMFISHDLHVVEYISDRVTVMYLGKVVETAPADEIYDEPLHPYTKMLIASTPSGDPDRRRARAPLTGDPPNPINPPSGCRFRTRCPLAMDLCAEKEPMLMPAKDGTRKVACHLYDERMEVTPDVQAKLTKLAAM
jgi:peptide/nickel transport system ATP-binding protein